MSEVESQRLLRSKRLRLVLWNATGGKCAICGCDLMDGWHADHVEPWVKSGRTNVHEMQALCPRCNLKKGARVFDASKYRPGQAQAHAVVVERVKAREPYTSIVLPTRYGKSDLIRTTAFTLQADKVVAGTVALTPALFLRQQMCSTDHVKAMSARYSIPYEQARLVNEVEPMDHNWFSNGEYLVGMTMQAATRSRDLMASFVESVMHRTGLPPLFFIDECHQTSNQKARGDLCKALTAAGASVVLVTATAIRADGEIIPGFDAEVLDEQEHKKYAVTDAGDGVHNNVDVYEGVRRLVRLKAHHETTFHEAWNEKNSPLCRLSREAIDASIEMTDGVLKLSDLSASDCRRYLSIASRMERVIRDGVRRMLSDLASRRRVREDIAAMVFTGNDEAADAEDNKHAKLVAKIIHDEQQNFDLKLRVVIATMKNEEGDEAAETKLREFVDGRGDVLIVKQMGGAGLDVGRVKVVLDLSTIRTVASCIQRYMRAATPYEGIKTATIITLKDELAEAIWQKCVVEEGGSVEHWHGSEYEHVEQYQVDKSDDADGEMGSIGETELGSLDDSDGNEADPATYDGAAFLIEKFPILLSHHTKAEIARNLTGAPFDIGGRDRPAVHSPPAIAVEIERERAHFNDLTKDLANRDAGIYGHGRGVWVEARVHYASLARQHAGVSGGTELRHITNLKTLRSMTTFLERQLSYGKKQAQN